MQNHPSPSSGNKGLLSKPYFNNAVKALQNLVTEIVLQMDQPYSSNEALLAVSRNDCVPIRSFPKFLNYDGQRRCVQNISVAKNTVLQVFACREFGSNEVMKTSFVKI